MALTGACASDSTTETGAAPPTTGVAVTARSSATTTEKIGGPAGTDLPTITLRPGNDTTTTIKTTPTTTKKVLGSEFVTASVAALRADLGDFRALQIVIHPDQPRATAQV